MPNERKQWAVLVYFAADVTSAEMVQAAIANWAQIESVGSSADVYVAAQIDLKDKPTKRYVFPVKNLLGAPPVGPTIMANVDSGLPATVQEFLQWGTDQCPAENVMFVFWGHGFGLDDYNPLPSIDAAARSTDELAANAEYSVARLAPAQDFSSTIDTYFTSLGVDDSSGSYLLNSQLASVLEGWKQHRNRNMSILGLDCCEMAMVEIWNQMVDCVDLAIGSQYLVPYKSWPYNSMLASLLAKPEMTPREVSAMVVDEFLKSYQSINNDVVALSACALAQTSTLDDALKSLASVLVQVCQDESTRSQIFASRNASPVYDDDGFIDLDTFCQLLQQNIRRSDLSQACDEVRQARAKYVWCSGFAPPGTDKMISLSKGVSIWFPGWIQYPKMAMLEKEESKRYLNRISATAASNASLRRPVMKT